VRFLIEVPRSTIKEINDSFGGDIEKTDGMIRHMNSEGLICSCERGKNNCGWLLTELARDIIVSSSGPAVFANMIRETNADFSI